MAKNPKTDPAGLRPNRATRRHQAEEDLERKAAEEDLAGHQAEEDLERKAAGEDLAEHQAEEDLERKAAGEDLAGHQAEEDLERKAAEEDLADHQAEEDLERKAAEEDLAEHQAGPDHFPSATATTGTLCGRPPRKGERVASDGDPTCPACRELLKLAPLEPAPVLPEADSKNGDGRPRTVEDLAAQRERDHQPSPVRPIEGTEPPPEELRCVALLPVYLGEKGGIGYLRCAHPRYGEALLCAPHQRLYLVTGPA